MYTLTGDEPDLQLGSSGQWVAELQSRLAGLGYYQGDLHGTYDMATESAVRMLQSQTGADNDGEMHRETWQLLVDQEQRYLQQYNSYAGPGRQDWDDPAWRQAGGGWDDRRAAGEDVDAGADAMASIGTMSDDGQWRWNGYDWEAADTSADHGDQGDVGAQDGAGQGYVGMLSDDGQWRWTGYGWEPATDANADGSATTDSQATDSQATDAQGYAGMLSDDGQWRWTGYEWEPAQAG